MRRPTLRGSALGLGVVIVLTACAGGSGPERVRATTSVRFRVGAGASPTDRARTVMLMEERFRAFGARGTSVAVEGDRLVATGPSSVRRLGPQIEARGVLEFRPVRGSLPPIGTEPGPSISTDDEFPSRSQAAPRYQLGPPAVTGGVRTASAADNGGNQGWTVAFSFTRGALTEFSRLAADLFPKPPPQNSVAIVMDGVVLSAPSFAASSFRGDVQISGDFDQAEAEALAAILRAGPYPVSVRLIS